MSGVFREEKNPPSLGSFVTGPYVGLVEAIDKHFIGSPCIGCDKPKAWVCDWMLMKRAKDAIEELLQLRALDQSEIVRLRRQIEVLQMSEDEKLKDLREGNRSPYRSGT